MTKLGKAVFIVVIVLATIGVLSMTDKLNWEGGESAEEILTTPTELHGEIIYSYGDVYKQRDEQLIKLSVGDIVDEGSIIKTNSESKVSILFDDGSTIRLDANSEIKIIKIQGEEILIENILGKSYSRVAKIDNREYSVFHNDVKATALGTIFVVGVKEDAVSIKVLESAVKISYKNNNQEISKGEELKINTATSEFSKEKIDDTEDSFIIWNENEDSKDNAKNIENEEEIIDEISKELIEEEEEEEEEEKVVVVEIEKKPVTTSNAITVSANDANVTWKTDNDYKKGFKVVWSKSSNPTYPTRATDRYAYYSNPETRNTEISAFDGTGTYYVRVCEYLGGKCGAYSNQTTTTLIKKEVVKEKETQEDGVGVNSLSINVSGNNATWTVDGYSKKGYKLVWSKSSNPTYPTRSGDKYIYISDPDTKSKTIHAFDEAGTYYVRVCEYLSGKCGVYSNQIEVELE